LRPVIRNSNKTRDGARLVRRRERKWVSSLPLAGGARPRPQFGGVAFRVFRSIACRRRQSFFGVAFDQMRRPGTQRHAQHAGVENVSRSFHAHREPQQSTRFCPSRNSSCSRFKDGTFLMRLPSDTGNACAPTAARSLKLTRMSGCRTRGGQLPTANGKPVQRTGSRTSTIRRCDAGHYDLWATVAGRTAVPGGGDPRKVVTTGVSFDRPAVTSVRPLSVRPILMARRAM
jgi:hypothetical protein